MALTLIDILGSHAAVGILLKYIPHSAHPTCKIVTFLRMRAASRKLSLFTTTSFLVPRLSMMARHRVQAVRECAKKVIESGWLRQLWPCTRLAIPWNDTSCIPLQNYDRNSGLPRGMRQSYFDKKQDEYRQGASAVLGWTYGRRSDDASLFCILHL